MSDLSYFLIGVFIGVFGTIAYKVLGPKDSYSKNPRSGENDYDDRMGSNAC